MNSKARGVWLAVLVGMGISLAAQAQVVPRARTVSEREFQHPDLFVPEVTEELSMLTAAMQQKLRPTLSSFGVSQESIWFDSRTGRPTSVILHEPMIPGSGKGNNLTWTAGAPLSDAALGDAAWKAVKAYLIAHKTDLRLDPNELSDTPRIGVADKGAIIFIYVPRVVGGISVRDNSIGIAINHGNLILLGMQKWGDVNVVSTPTVSAQGAKDVVASYVRPSTVFRTIKEPNLEIVPTAGNGTIDYRLVWVVSSKVDSDFGQWESLVDASNGTIVAFKDKNRYGAGSGVISAGVYPISNDQVPPDGVEQPSWPMPYVDYTINGVKQYTDVGGNVGCIPGSLSTALSGLYLKINDDCGSISETGSGGADLGSGPTPGATDCTVPPGHSAGDTKSARSGYYELNHQMEKARGQLTDPSNPAYVWLHQQLTAEMNENSVCNAFWDGTQVNFFRSAIAQGCRNTGEIAGIFDHEWGHGLDNNGVNPNIVNPGEDIADTYAMLRINVSCMGRGFFTDSTCGGYGDECVGTAPDGCTGVRDMDFAQHRCDAPHTITWVQSGFTSAQCATGGGASGCPSGSGPCGREVHCEGMVAGETAWDLSHRDLEAAPFNYDERTAHEVAARLYYLGLQPVTSSYTCSVGGGCSATSQYMSLLAVDDDNGDITDGTPHMTAIRAAFERHEIHCATPAPVNSGCASAPIGAPIVTLTPHDRSISVTWTAVAGASSYLVYRSDGVDGCNIGKAIIANTPELSFVDEGLANGRTYSYGVVPVGSSSTCSGPMSACAQAAPVAGPNLSVLNINVIPGGDGDAFVDNCELTTVTFNVNNDGLGDLTNVRIESVTPVTHPLTQIVTPLPEVLQPTTATCTNVGGSFQFIPQGLTFDGSTDLVFTVTADELDGDTRSALVHIEHTESDLVLVSQQIYSFETDSSGWTTTSGTFVQKTGGGASGTSGYMASSDQIDNACDVVQSPLIVLSDTSAVDMRIRYDIEPPSGGQNFDRANFSVYNVQTGQRTVVTPSSGRPYQVPDGSANGSCGTSGQAGWNATTPGYPSLWYDVVFNSAALNPGGVFSGVPIRLEINYGTDGSVAGHGIQFDEVKVTNFYGQGPDQQPDVCSGTAVSPAALVVDGAGNGVLEVGETVVVSPSWSNTGAEAVTLSGTASNFTGPDGPTYNLTDATGAYDPLNPAGTGACTDCYGVNITAETRPSTHWDASLTEDVNTTGLQQGALGHKVWTLHVGGSFADVPSSNGFYSAIETVLHNGVTAGCGDGTSYCPTDIVSRQQMAVFLLKAKEGSSYNPPTCTTQVFDDVPCSSAFAPWVNELVTRGVTAGCGGGLYCPTNNVPRQQMAVFIVKTFGLLLYGP